MRVCKFGHLESAEKLNRFSCMIHATHGDSQQKLELNSTSKINEAVHLCRELHILTQVSAIAPVAEL